MLTNMPSVPTTTTSPALTANCPALASVTAASALGYELKWGCWSLEEKRRCFRRAAVKEERSFFSVVREKCSSDG
jgi:hypothetical protein